MERYHLEYLTQTAKHQSITRAAEAINISQPSLSQQIINIENELGVKLFERRKKQVITTEAGEAFIHAAERILNSFDELKETMTRRAIFSNTRKERGVG